MKKIRCILLFFFLIVSSVSAAEITTSYAQTSPITWSSNNHEEVYLTGTLNAHLGQLTIDIPSDQKTQSFFFTGLGSYTYCNVTGMTFWGSKQTTSAALVYVVKVDGIYQGSSLVWSGQGDNAIQSILGNGNNRKGSVITIDYYLKVNADQFFFKEGNTLTIDTDLALSKIGYSTTGNIWQEESRVILPLNGGGGYDEDSYEIINGGVSKDHIESTYGDVKQLDVLFDIINTAEDIDFNEAVGSQKRKIADMEVLITGEAKTYDLSVTFDDAKGGSEFLLTHKGGMNTIPFDLYAGYDQISKGVAYYGWSGIEEGATSLKELFVSGIDAATAQTSVAGTYSDTITISLTVL